jgi:hypothetical protein
MHPAGPTPTSWIVGRVNSVVSHSEFVFFFCFLPSSCLFLLLHPSDAHPYHDHCIVRTLHHVALRVQWERCRYGGGGGGGRVQTQTQTQPKRCDPHRPSLDVRPLASDGEVEDVEGTLACVVAQSAAGLALATDYCIFNETHGSGSLMTGCGGRFICPPLFDGVSCAFFGGWCL